MKKKLVISTHLVFLVLICATGSAWGHGIGSFQTGNSILNKLQSSSYFKREQAEGYIAGVSDAFDLAAYVNNGGKGVSCMPASVTLGQIVGITKNYLVLHPETRDKGAAYLILMAEKKTFGCLIKNP